MQAVAWNLTILLVGVVAVVFLLVHGYSARAVDYGVVQTRAYRLRALLFSALIVLGIPAMGYTLLDLPYAAAGSQAAPQIVTVTGYQWRWELDRDRVKAGQPVEFRVSSADVNHGVGIYDSDTRLLAQTQAMPGYVNRLRYTFEKAGTYRIMCLEFCGLAHHQMIAEISVLSR